MQSGKQRLGRFFFFVGLILLVIFFAMDQAQNPSYGYFCGGVVVLVLGGILMARKRQEPVESMRFRTLRRWREQQKQHREERKKQPLER